MNYAMTLKQQANVCERLMLSCLPHPELAGAIANARFERASYADAKRIRDQLEHFRDQGTQDARTEAEWALRLAQAGPGVITTNYDEILPCS
jgi:hypothetical protein